MTKPTRWRPLQRHERIIPVSIIAAAAQDAELAAALDADGDTELWANDQYVVHLERYSNGDAAHLSVRRRDRRAVRDWRHLQLIKNELAGEHAEAVELYPDEDRLVDSANQYHLWVLPAGQRFPFGFPDRLVLDADEADHRVPGVVQRPLAEGTG